MTRITIPVALALMALVGSLLAVTGSEADAQPSQATRLTVNTEEIQQDGAVAVSIDLTTGTADLAALQIAINYDHDSMSAERCDVAGHETTGDVVADHEGMGDLIRACGIVDGQIKLVALNPDTIPDIDGFVNLEFMANPGVDELDLDLVVDLAVDGHLNPIDVETVFDDKVVAAALGSLSGQIVDVANLGLAGIEVCATHADGEQTCLTSSGIGYFFADLKVGDYTITMTDPSGELGPVTIEATVTEDQVTNGVSATLSAADETDEEEVDESPSAGTITGTVTADGEPVFAIRVCATMVVVGTQDCGYSKSDGTFSLEGLPVGNYNITTQDSSGTYEPAEVQVVGVGVDSGVAGVEINLG